MATLRAEAADLHAQLSKALSESAYLRGRCERLTCENRVLRREQRGGKRDEVVLQLETELAHKEQVSKRAATFLACTRDDMHRSIPPPKIAPALLPLLIQRVDLLRRLSMSFALVCCEQERADMEENLAKAFGAAIQEAHERIARLTTERDRLLVSVEEGTKRGRKFLS